MTPMTGERWGAAKGFHMLQVCHQGDEFYVHEVAALALRRS